ncbi:MAG: L-rhamnose mutarotase [Flavitalea sp.]
MKKRYCFALDLKDDAQLIEEYKEHHKVGRPDVIERIKQDGIEVMDLYITGNRLFMIMEVNETFSFEKKAASDAALPEVREWEEFMWSYQQALPWAKPGEKWVLMEKMFSLK